jgi:hypothetical protein
MGRDQPDNKRKGKSRSENGLADKNKHLKRRRKNKRKQS